jgi:hypothetical protein
MNTHFISTCRAVVTGSHGVFSVPHRVRFNSMLVVALRLREQQAVVPSPALRSHR